MKSKKITTMDYLHSSLPSVTVVIPAYNEEHALRSCLMSVINQDYTGPIQIIVIDNASSDSTVSIAQSMHVKVIPESQKGYIHAIKRGFDEARSDIVASTDADTIVPVNWISNLVRNFTDQSVVACGGVFDFCDGPLWMRIIGLLGRLNYHIAGANMAIRKNAYDLVGGFSSNINLGADVDLGRKLAKVGKVIIDRSIVVFTSSRRFQGNFFETVFRYYINDLVLLTCGKPLFYSFKNYRANLGKKRSNGYAVAGIITLSICLLSTLIMENPMSQTLGTVLSKGKMVSAVALTFDDGPGNSTNSILKILDQYNARATFFIIGKNAESNPVTVKHIAASGHEIGNHSYSHPLGSVIDVPSKIYQQIEKTDSIIQSITGVKCKLFRPPHGWRSPWMINECRKIDKSMVLWSIDSKDWQHKSPSLIIKNVLSTVKPGSIILFHDRLNTGKDIPMNNTIIALPVILDSLVNRGYSFVTVSALQKMQPIHEHVSIPQNIITKKHFSLRNLSLLSFFRRILPEV